MNSENSSFHYKAKAEHDMKESPREPMRARPVEGKLDHVALIREHLRRFPVIRKALRESETA